MCPASLALVWGTLIREYWTTIVTFPEIHENKIVCIAKMGPYEVSLREFRKLWRKITHSENILEVPRELLDLTRKILNAFEQNIKNIEIFFSRNWKILFRAVHESTNFVIMLELSIYKVPIIKIGPIEQELSRQKTICKLIELKQKGYFICPQIIEI